jgi:predicted small lipoprotein YifL
MTLDVIMWLAAMTMLMFGLAACGTPGTPSATTTNAAAGTASQFPLTRCMRSHGVPNFPDPAFPAGGGIAQNGGTTINRDSPAFQAAVAACNKEGS